MFSFSSRRRHTRCSRDWSSDVCSSDLRRGRLRALRLQAHLPPLERPEGVTEALAAVAGALLVALVFVAWMLLRQIEGARSQAHEGQESVRKEVGDLARRVKDEVGGLQQRVATELKGVSAEVSRQLQEGMRLIQSAQATMGDRLDSAARVVGKVRSEEHTSELQSRLHLVCRLLLEKKKNITDHSRVD